MIEVRPARAEDIAPLTEVRARAFYDDPTERWLFPDDRTRLDSLRRAARHGLRRSVSLGASWCTSDRSATATWRRPGETPPGQLRGLLGQIALAPLLLRFGPPLRAALNADGLLRHHRPAEPHWTLGSIATHPDAQRRGRATALLTAGLAECDSAAMPCFLATSKPANVAFYESFGFRVTEEIELPAGGPREILMARPPHGAG